MVESQDGGDFGVSAGPSSVIDANLRGLFSDYNMLRHRCLRIDHTEARAIGDRSVRGVFGN